MSLLNVFLFTVGRSLQRAAGRRPVPRDASRAALDFTAALNEFVQENDMKQSDLDLFIRMAGDVATIATTVQKDHDDLVKLGTQVRGLAEAINALPNVTLPPDADPAALVAILDAIDSRSAATSNATDSLHETVNVISNAESDEVAAGAPAPAADSPTAAPAADTVAAAPAADTPASAEASDTVTGGQG